MWTWGHGLHGLCLLFDDILPCFVFMAQLRFAQLRFIVQLRSVQLRSVVRPCSYYSCVRRSCALRALRCSVHVAWVIAAAGRSSHDPVASVQPLARPLIFFAAFAHGDVPPSAEGLPLVGSGH
jgi:hypothetical protein